MVFRFIENLAQFLPGAFSYLDIHFFTSTEIIFN